MTYDDLYVFPPDDADFAALPIIRNKKIIWLKKTMVIERKYMSWCDIFDSFSNETLASKSRCVWKIEDIQISG